MYADDKTKPVFKVTTEICYLNKLHISFHLKEWILEWIITKTPITALTYRLNFLEATKIYLRMSLGNTVNATHASNSIEELFQNCEEQLYIKSLHLVGDI